jgi:hypothetical protein
MDTTSNTRTRSRRRRGADSQRIVARRLQADIYPFAEPIGAGQSGRDITGTPGTAGEIKARRGLNLGEWLRQAVRQAGAGDVPILAVRLDGQGEAGIDEWPAVLPLGVLVQLLRDAGYGTPPDGGTPSGLPAPASRGAIDGSKIEAWPASGAGSDWLGCLPCAAVAAGRDVPPGMAHAPDCPHALGGREAA